MWRMHAKRFIMHMNKMYTYGMPWLEDIQIGEPDKFMFPFVLKACYGLGALDQGKEIHYHIQGTALDFHVYVANALISLKQQILLAMSSPILAIGLLMHIFSCNDFLPQCIARRNIKIFFLCSCGKDFDVYVINKQEQEVRWSNSEKFGEVRWSNENFNRDTNTCKLHIYTGVFRKLPLILESE